MLHLKGSSPLTILRCCIGLCNLKNVSQHHRHAGNSAEVWAQGILTGVAWMYLLLMSLASIFQLWGYALSSCSSFRHVHSSRQHCKWLPLKRLAFGLVNGFRNPSWKERERRTYTQVHRRWACGNPADVCKLSQIFSFWLNWWSRCYQMTTQAVSCFASYDLGREDTRIGPFNHFRCCSAILLYFFIPVHSDNIRYRSSE